MRAGAYLGSKRIMRYHEMGLVHKNECKIYHMHHQIEYKITYGTHDILLKFIFILSKTSLMLGLPTKPNLSFINGSHKFIILELWEKNILAYVKSRETEDYLKIRVELKLFERKLDFFYFWNLFENWSLEDYLKIGVLGVKFKNWKFEK